MKKYPTTKIYTLRPNNEQNKLQNWELFEPKRTLTLPLSERAQMWRNPRQSRVPRNFQESPPDPFSVFRRPIEAETDLQKSHGKLTRVGATAL